MPTAWLTPDDSARLNGLIAITVLFDHHVLIRRDGAHDLLSPGRPTNQQLIDSLRSIQPQVDEGRRLRAEGIGRIELADDLASSDFGNQAGADPLAVALVAAERNR